MTGSDRSSRRIPGDDDYVYFHTMERCNPCLVALAGWRTRALIGRVWSPKQAKYVPTDDLAHRAFDENFGGTDPKRGVACAPLMGCSL